MGFAVLETGYSTNFPIGRTTKAQAGYFQGSEKVLTRLDAETAPNGLVWLGVHELCDEDTKALLDPEAHFGLLTSDSLKPKVGYSELQRIIRLHP